MTSALCTTLRFALAACACLFAAAALAYDGIVKKEVFTLPAYTTVGGKTIKNVRIGYETYGKLNAAKDNVVVISHFYTRHLPRRRQIHAGRQGARLLGRDHRLGSRDRHRSLLRHQHRHAG